MRDFDEKCVEEVSDPKIVRAERSKRFVVKNPGSLRVRVIEIDGCVITKGLRCDWLFVVTGDPMEIYVELKGSAVGHGIKQIEATIPKVSEDARSAPKHCYIVSSCVAPALSTKLQRAKARFDRDYSAVLIVKNTPAEHRLAAQSKRKRRR